MTADWDVNMIVGEVLRRLAAHSAGHAASRTPSSKSNDETPAGNGQLQLTERVVTLATLEGRWNGITGISVSPKAVITPAVHDELRRRGVALKRHQGPAAGSAALQLLLATEDVRVCLREWQQRLGAAETAGPLDLDALAMRLASWVTPQRVAVLWSPRPVWATCVANRHAAVRAAMAADLAEVRRAVDVAGANVLILDSSRSAGAWKQWIQTFIQGTYRLAPAS